MWLFIFAPVKKMKRSNNISIFAAATRVASVIIMCVSLMFLTGANFFVYNGQHCEKKVAASSDSEENEAPSPVEEKSKSSGTSIQEEYLHDKCSLRLLAASTVQSRYHIPNEEKLQVVHFELLSPPPEL